MKNESNFLGIETPPEKDYQLIDFEVEEGASIVFTPTGEQWRITSVEKGKIVFERVP